MANQAAANVKSTSQWCDCFVFCRPFPRPLSFITLQVSIGNDGDDAPLSITLMVVKERASKKTLYSLSTEPNLVPLPCLDMWVLLRRLHGERRVLRWERLCIQQENTVHLLLVTSHPHRHVSLFVYFPPQQPFLTPLTPFPSADVWRHWRV